GFTRFSVPRIKLPVGRVDLSSVDFRDPTLIYATFNLVGTPVGSYEFEVIDGVRSDSIPNGFTVTNTPIGTDTLALDLIVPDSVRAGRKGKVLVEYTNIGSANIPAPLLLLTATNANLRLPGQAEFGGADLTFFGHAPDGPAGTLRPGQRGSVEIEFESTG